MKCRRCQIEEGVIYLDGRNNRTRTPVCQNCYERLVMGGIGRDLAGGYRGYRKDPEHDHLPSEHEECQEWWDKQTDMEN